MRFKIDHDYHIHSYLSSCSSDPKQTSLAIIDYAIKNGFKSICLTDHYWDSAVEGASGWYKPQNFEHIKQSLPLPQDENCRFMFGCETDMDKSFKIGIPEERYDDFDFIIVPTTHLHMTGFTYIPEEENVKDKTKLYIKRFEALLESELPFEKVGIAHLTCPLIYRDEERYLDVLDSVSDAEFEYLFARCAELGCGIELNIGMKDLERKERQMSVLRPYIIAKRQGCKFYFGSDAHHPEGLEGAMSRFEKTADLLSLTEDDKFIIK